MAKGTLNYSEIIKGSALMLFLGEDKDNAAVAPVSFATEHTFEVNTENVEIVTKDNGDYPGYLAQRFTWTVSASNLVSKTGVQTYLKYQKSMKPIKIKYAVAAEYNPYGDDDGAEKGIIGDNVDQTAWTPDATQVIAEGSAIVENVSINSSAGDNSTMSIQLRGTGPLTLIGDTPAVTPNP